MGGTPRLAHFVWPHPPSRGQHQPSGEAGPAVFPGQVRASLAENALDKCLVKTAPRWR